MPAPTQISEDDLKAYLHDRLGDLAPKLGWTVDASYDDVLIDALVEYGVSDVRSVSGLYRVALLKAEGRYILWRKVAEHTAGEFSRSAEGHQVNPEQVHAQALAAMRLAQEEIDRLKPKVGIASAHIVSMVGVSRPSDPYEALETAYAEIDGVGA